MERLHPEEIGLDEIDHINVKWCKSKMNLYQEDTSFVSLNKNEGACKLCLERRHVLQCFWPADREAGSEF